VSFILKLVLILIVFSFVVYVFKAMTRMSHRVSGTVKDLRQLREQVGAGKVKPASAEMVRCAACGSFVFSRDAMTLTTQGRAQTFCSQECIRAHVKSA